MLGNLDGIVLTSARNEFIWIGKVGCPLKLELSFLHLCLPLIDFYDIVERLREVKLLESTQNVILG